MAADRPAATVVATVGVPSLVNVGKACTAIMPTSATPRATSTPSRRSRRGTVAVGTSVGRSAAGGGII